MKKGHDSLIFWVALVFSMVFYEIEHNKIQSRKFDLIDEKHKASNTLKYANSICRDGSYSMSIGGGTCSHHDGISTPNHALQSTAKMDPEKITESRVNKLRLWLLLMLACSYYLGPRIENFFKSSKTNESATPLRKISAPPVQAQLISNANPLPLYLPLPNAVTNELTCPKCGKLMIKRTAKRGKSKGQLFFGCSKFPYCNGTRPINKT